MRHFMTQSYQILSKVFQDGQYSTFLFNRDEIPDMTTKIVYGVLEENVRLDKIIRSLTEKKPKNSICILLKIGIYCLLNLDNVPDYAIVSECVEAAKMNGKATSAGFINAVLKKVASGEFKEEDSLSYRYSKPEWFISILINQYGKEKTEEILSEKSDFRVHIRPNLKKTTLDDIKKNLDKLKIAYEETDVHGLAVNYEDSIKKLFNKGLITIQTPSSMKAVQVLNPENGKLILDLCSAPGGKAVYMSEICPDSKITACDLYEHRLNLINSYIKRMQATHISVKQEDGTKFNYSFMNKYDYVLVDAPCSCSGTYRKNPDIFIMKDLSDTSEITSTQKAILANAINYVKKGGVIVYSTCSVFDEENHKVVEEFLKSGKAELKEELSILPHGVYDGFYIARMVKL
ncbi:MAG: 16S rRNA (cytosine(967)-C(5))-methyltransferase RsmB [Clostridia bacterium]|nr:16S rRNA (cytosine(967)-C(5))-methyltransferase RsmB [Clostridia bacterium]